MIIYELNYPPLPFHPSPVAENSFGQLLSYLSYNLGTWIQFANPGYVYQYTIETIYPFIVHKFQGLRDRKID